MKNKKASHVGVILSFVIFVTFLVFLFSILGSPIKLPSNKEPLINYLEVEMIRKFSLNVTVLTISPTISGSEDCIKIDYGSLNLDYLEGLNSLAKDKDNNILNSRLSSEDLLIYRDPTGDDFFKIYYSERTLDSSGNPSCLDSYDIISSDVSAVRENRYFNINKINEFFLNYTSNYDILKTEFNVPQNAEFGLSFTNAEGVTNMTNIIDSSIDIFAREIPIQYLDESANINSGFINIKVW